MERQQQYVHRLAEIDAKVRRARLAPDVLIAQAAGLLAGRVGCRVDEAQAYLLQLASEQRREPHLVATELIAGLEAGLATNGVQLDEIVRPPRPEPPVQAPRPRSARAATPDWAAAVQQVLEAMPGRHTLLEAVRDAAGSVVDFTVVAATPLIHEDQARRKQPDPVGSRIGVTNPDMVDGPIWQAWLGVLADGEPREVGPTLHVGRSELDPAEIIISSRVTRVGHGVLTSWIRHDEEERLTERVTQTERLGNLGWGEADLITGEVSWSDELYRIYERDPALGPMMGDESQALTVPEDLPIHRKAAEQFGRGETVDVSYRVRINGRVKYLRTVLDAVRDLNGRPIRVYGIIQDITVRENIRAKLADVERQLHEQRQTLAAEHRLTRQLQHIVLPVPDVPVDLPGLRVALRYLPAEQASRVGGDWYHAAPADDGSVILAVGDVAGHGIQAATAMAEMRHTLAALTLTTTSDPAELLGHLNRLLCGGRSTTETATAVIARYEPADATLTWAQAGHPPPLRSSGGITAELPRPAGIMLGALSDARYATARLRLDLGDLILFYTDGLIEHRDHRLGDGLVPVVATLDRIAASSSTNPLADLLGQLRRANPDDDTCLLAVRRLPGEPADGRFNCAGGRPRRGSRSGRVN